MAIMPHGESRGRRAAVAGGVVLLALLVAGGVLLGGAPAGERGGSAPTRTVGPAPTVPISAVPTTADLWATLRARPLAVPTLAAGAACPAATGAVVSSDFASALGPGPVYPIGLGSPGRMEYSTDPTVFAPPWGGQKVLWIAAPTYAGPALVRGRQLDGANEVRFGRDANPTAELQLDATRGDATPTGWRNWPGYTRVRAPGCYAYQVDGLNFTRVLIFQAQPAAP